MRLDPRTKLGILAITSISVFLNRSIVIECLLVSIPLFLLLLSGNIKKALRYGGLFLSLLFIQLFLVRHFPLIIGGIVYMFAVYIRKLIPCFMLGTYLIKTTKLSSFLAAVSRFHLPKGFTIALSITLRYFPAMSEEWNAIRDAMALRGISASAAGLIAHPIKTMEYIYVPMLVSASRISDEISQVAITRGIDHAGRRSCLEETRFTVWDAIAAIVYGAMVGMMTAAPFMKVM